jgi:hypothetical protein
MDDKWKAGLLRDNLSLWKMLGEILSESDSEEKLEYYAEYANSVHSDFSAIILACNFALALCYCRITKKNLEAEEYSAATLNLNLCEEHFHRFLQAKEYLKNKSFPLA